MSKETDGIIAAMMASGIEHVVTDINTVGQHAANGNHYAKDCHAATPVHQVDTTAKGDIGRAVDFAHKRFDGKQDTDELLAIYNCFVETYGRNGRLVELFYAGPGADDCVISGKFMKWNEVAKATRDAIRAGHHDHVHAAVANGVVLATPTARLLKSKEDEDMPKPDNKVDACRAPGGGVWTLTYDGGVRATQGAPFFGSYPGLPADRRKGQRNFVAIEPDETGYTIISDDDQASQYHFDAAVFAEISKRK